MPEILLNSLPTHRLLGPIWSMLFLCRIHTATNIFCIKNVQRVIRFGYNKYYWNQSVISLRLSLNLCTLQNRSQNFKLIMLYKIINNYVEIPNTVVSILNFVRERTRMLSGWDLNPPLY